MKAMTKITLEYGVEGPCIDSSKDYPFVNKGFEIAFVRRKYSSERWSVS